MRKFDIECRLIINYNFNKIYDDKFAQIVGAKNILKEVKPMEKRVAKAGYEDLFELINSKIDAVEEEVRKAVAEKTAKLTLLLEEVSDVVIEEDTDEISQEEGETFTEETNN